jgi:hypothetical protein
MMILQAAVAPACVWVTASTAGSPDISNWMASGSTWRIPSWKASGPWGTPIFANSLRRVVPFLDAAIGARAVSVEDATSDGEDVGTVTFSGGSLSLGGGVSFFTSEKFAIETLVKFTGGTFEQIDVGDVSVRNLDIDASSFRFKVGVSWWP